MIAVNKIDRTDRAKTVAVLQAAAELGRRRRDLPAVGAHRRAVSGR